MNSTSVRESSVTPVAVTGVGRGVSFGPSGSKVSTSSSATGNFTFASDSSFCFNLRSFARSSFSFFS
jgi:hypothetical protein